MKKLSIIAIILSLLSALSLTAFADSEPRGGNKVMSKPSIKRPHVTENNKSKDEMSSTQTSHPH